MKQILLGIAITLLGGVNLYAQSSKDITPFTKYDYSTRSVGQETIGGFFANANPNRDYLISNYNEGLFVVCGGQMIKTPANQKKLQDGTSIVDMGGEVGKVLCINGANSDFNDTFNVSYPKNSGDITGWVNLNWTTDPNTTPTDGTTEDPNIHVKIVMNVYAGSTNTFKDVNTFDNVNIVVKYDGQAYSTYEGVKPSEFYTEKGNYDITKWMTYEFDTYCENKDTSKPIRLSLNISNKGAINNTTIFIKEISFTKIDPANKTGFKKSFSTINATALIYNEAATNTFKEITNTNLTINRPMASDKWNTFCVPFALTKDQITATFDAGTQVREYEGANGNVLTFKEATDIKAGTPYLIKPAKAAEKYIFNNVDITTTEAAKVGDGDIKFCGVYNQSNVNNLAETGSHVSGIVDNMVKRAQAGTSIKGFRAYFSVPNNISESAEAALRVAIDGETTGIDAIEGIDTNTPTRVYNLSGQYVGTSTANLKPGVYVSGGKKVIVK